jgi:lysophospholipase L1-like esterase
VLSLAQKVIFGAATSALLLAAAECCVRLARCAPPKSDPPPLEFVNADFGSGFPIERDETLFWRLRADGAIPNGTETINHEGYRGPSVERPKPGGTRRILCIGDSSTFGIGVAEDATYARRLERWLASSPTRWEVVNVGVPGYTSFQMARFVATRARDLEPDVIVVYAGAWNEYMPAIGSDDAHSAGRMRDWAIGRRGLSLERLHLVRWFRKLLAGVQSTSRPSKTKEYVWQFSTKHERPDGPRVAPEDFRANLAEIARLTKEMAARPLFVTPPLPAKTRERVPDGEDYARIVREVAAAENVTLADARERLTRPIEEDSQYFGDGVHPNDTGHGIVAASLGSAMKRAGLVDAALVPPGLLAERGLELKPLQKLATLRAGDGGVLLSSTKYAEDDPHLIVVPSPTTLQFDGLDIPDRAALIVWLSRRRSGPESQPASPDETITFTISLVRKGGAQVELMRREVTGLDAGWNSPLRQRVDLTPFAGQRVSLVFGVKGNVYRACWGAARIEPYH